MRPAALFLALFVLAGCASVHSQAGTIQPARWVEIDGAMLEFLDGIHAGLENEMVLCMSGAVTGDVVRVTEFRATAVHAATRGSVSYQPCGRDEFVGIVHSHPPGGGCYLSEPDLENARKYDHAIDLIVCGSGVFAWRTKGAHGIIARHVP